MTKNDVNPMNILWSLYQDGYGGESGASDETENENWPFWYPPQGDIKRDETKCTCGAAAVKSDKHVDYCDLERVGLK